MELPQRPQLQRRDPCQNARANDNGQDSDGIAEPAVASFYGCSLTLLLCPSSLFDLRFQQSD